VSNIDRNVILQDGDEERWIAQCGRNANALLLAASPDLLRAATGAVQLCEWLLPATLDPELKERLEELRDLCYTAIAKAEG